MQVGNIVLTEDFGVNTAIVVTGNNNIGTGSNKPLTHSPDFLRFETSHVAELDLDLATQKPACRIVFFHGHFQRHLHLLTITGVRPGEWKRRTD